MYLNRKIEDIYHRYIKKHCVISPNSVRMRENTEQENSKYGHFSRSGTLQIYLNCNLFTRWLLCGFRLGYFCGFPVDTRRSEDTLDVFWYVRSIDVPCVQGVTDESSLLNSFPTGIIPNHLGVLHWYTFL